ncbi:MAG TPA: NDP-sugar synthase [Chloroflexia bacterium]|nr:NDP-sugar synthase [Chloroflexia bacterium]
MKALILAGGQGTRLRPLTANTPKPLIPLVNRPFLDHILYLLRTHGINDVVFAMAYLSDNFEEEYGDGSHLGMRLTYVHEAEPLGTGGAIKNAQAELHTDEAFLVFNGDILTDLDLSDMLRLHRESGSVCTISLTPVSNPSAYGVVDVDDVGRIQRFTEKPKHEEATSNWINAGIYILEPSTLEHIPEGNHYMVERGLFPTLLAEGAPLYGYRTGAYWLDIGTPAKYIQAHADLLAGHLKSSLPPEGEQLTPNVWAGEGTFVHTGARITGPVVLGKHCRIYENASLVGPLALADGCEVRAGAELTGVVAWRNATFGEKSICQGCMVGNDARIGANCRLDELVIIGDNASVGSGNHITRGTKLSPGHNLPDRIS